MYSGVWVCPGIGCVREWEPVSDCLRGVTLEHASRYSGQPQAWDTPVLAGACQIFGSRLV